jgi:hypothetical protein
MFYAEFKVRVRINPPWSGWHEEGDEGYPSDWTWPDLLQNLGSGTAEQPTIIDYWEDR